MKAEDKPKYLSELKTLFSSLDKEKLLGDPDNEQETQRLNRISAILRNFSSDIGEEIERRKTDFQKWCRAGKRQEHSKNVLNDLLQYIHTKIEEMDVYKIEPDKTYESDNGKLFDLKTSVWPLGDFYYLNFIKRFYKGKNGKVSKIKIAIIVTIAVVLGAITYGAVKNRPHFDYEMLGKVYEARDNNVPTVIDGWFTSKIRNISEERRYLEYIHYILWRDQSLGRSWIYGYGVGDVYEVNGGERRLVELPILFEPNEVKTLALDVDIPISDKEPYLALTEREGEGVFTWPKNEINILLEDSRGNIFDESGKLLSQEVTDTWWVLPNNKNFKSKIIADTDLYSKIVVWKIRRFLHILN